MAAVVDLSRARRGAFRHRCRSSSRALGLPPLRPISISGRGWCSRCGFLALGSAFLPVGASASTERAGKELRAALIGLMMGLISKLE